MFLDTAHEQWGWPSRDEVFTPTATGAGLLAQLASDKLGRAISRRPDGDGVRVGVLAANPNATESPIAIICEFPRKVSEETLRETHRLAWNFCHSRLLITIEPHVVRKWSCCEPPVAGEIEGLFDTIASPEIGPPLDLDSRQKPSASEHAVESLHWVEFISGRFFETHEQRFRPDKRADQMLLRNLAEVRERLMEAGLDDDKSHDLLARVIFIQFLFDRKDTEGKAALNAEELHRLHSEGELASHHESFGDILSDYEDTYSLFRWLNDKFNGDLFPGKGSALEQEAAWADERSQVTPENLELLARFVSGEERMKDGQLSLWPYYAFDAIPLDFISTIYEQFVRKETGTGIHYTPAHLVDLMLDSVLPWNGDEWNLKIIDPSCGSGVFLVKAFQRIIHRWKRSHPDESINGEVLAGLLERNLFGVDKDLHAVRVASFSLYLAMCDEIDPRDYWKDVRFPVLRGRRLVADDFFSEDYAEFGSAAAGSYDLVVGNPPWGKNTATDLARDWAKKNEWPISYGDFGPLFLAKALTLVRPNGRVALVQPASTLLYNSTSAALKLRSRVFAGFQVEEIVNLAALRYVMFKDAIVPACAIVVRNAVSDEEPFWYSCPKPLHTQEDRYRIAIEPNDIHLVHPHEVESFPHVWATLMWGSRRDLAFIGRLSRHANLASLEDQGLVRARQGIIRSKSSYREYPELLDRPLLLPRDFPIDDSLFLDAGQLAINRDANVYSKDSTDFRAFNLPQLVVKQTCMKTEQRFRAAIIKSSENLGGAICTDSFASVHLEHGNPEVLENLCLVFNSALALYFLLLTSGRFAMDRNEPQLEDFRSVPVPESSQGVLAGVSNVSDVDERVRTMFGFSEAQWILVEDLMDYTLPDYKEGANSPGRSLTTRNDLIGGIIEPELTAYCETLRRVLHAAFGPEKHIGAVIFSEPTGERLPVRLVSVYLNEPDISSVQVEEMGAPDLRSRLTKLYLELLATKNSSQYHQRTVRTYDALQTKGTGIVVNLIKPDQVRYWTRSMAMRDADEIVADFLLWQGAQNAQSMHKQATHG